MFCLYLPAALKDSLQVVQINQKNNKPKMHIEFHDKTGLRLLCRLIACMYHSGAFAPSELVMLLIHILIVPSC